ncbi:SORF2 domain protein [Nile crocodilepox virus]|uniref:SORF2 domain protein n=1 Tax=Nile crocodilepox virus (isolate Crocodylus niloticus/Zimbabwe/Ume/2001) TaxID=1289473 RepID=Q070N0_CPRVZ|nr:SORF2 domain protein [Nile crocodilepox virus]ABJ08912.1 SORF2 domain protein [Nile crocodilepox virus]
MTRLSEFAHNFLRRIGFRRRDSCGQATIAQPHEAEMRLLAKHLSERPLAGPDLIACYADRHRGRHLYFAKQQRCCLRVGDLSSTFYGDLEHQMEDWAYLYLPRPQRLAVLGSINNILGTVNSIRQMENWQQLVILVSEFGTVFAADCQEVHVLASSLEQFLRDGVLNLGREFYTRQESRRTMREYMMEPAVYRAHRLMMAQADDCVNADLGSVSDLLCSSSDLPNAMLCAVRRPPSRLSEELTQELTRYLRRANAFRIRPRVTLDASSFGGLAPATATASLDLRGEARRQRRRKPCGLAVDAVSETGVRAAGGGSKDASPAPMMRSWRSAGQSRPASRAPSASPSLAISMAISVATDSRCGESCCAEDRGGGDGDSGGDAVVCDPAPRGAESLVSLDMDLPTGVDQKTEIKCRYLAPREDYSPCCSLCWPRFSWPFGS